MANVEAEIGVRRDYKEGHHERRQEKGRRLTTVPMVGWWRSSPLIGI